MNIEGRLKKLESQIKPVEYPPDPDAKKKLITRLLESGKRVIDANTLPQSIAEEWGVWLVKKGLALKDFGL